VHGSLSFFQQRKKKKLENVLQRRALHHAGSIKNDAERRQLPLLDRAASTIRAAVFRGFAWKSLASCRLTFNFAEARFAWRTPRPLHQHISLFGLTRVQSMAEIFA